MRGLGLSAIYIAAIVLVIAAELFPPTGIFLMFMLGPLWAAVIFNIWMGNLILDAWTGRIALLWLVLPVFFYVGYEAAAIGVYLDARAMRGQIEQANALNLGAVPAGRIAVVIDAEQNEIGANSAAPYAAVADGYDVYYGDYLLKRFERGDPSCDAPFWHPRQAQQRFKVFGPMGTGMRECYVAIAAPAPRPAIHIVKTPQTATSYVERQRGQRGFAAFATLRGTDFTLAARDGSLVRLGHARAGEISFPFLLPLAFAGCSLNSGAPSWDCAFQPMHGTMTVGGGEGYSDYEVSHARYLLGLLHLPVRD